MVPTPDAFVMLEAALSALLIVFDPTRLGIVAVGVAGAAAGAAAGASAGSGAGTATFDSRSDLSGLDAREARRRALRYFGWCLFILVAALIIGLLPAMLVFLIGYLRLEVREGWAPTLSVALGTWAAAYGLFHLLLRVPWPTAWLGDLVPVLRASGLTNLL